MDSPTETALFRSTLSVTLNSPTNSIQDSVNMDINENSDVYNERNATDTNCHDGLNVVYNKQSVTITFPSDKLDAIEESMRANLQFVKRDKQNGDIFKSPDSTVTATLYKSTNHIHVQGNKHRRWTTNFCEIFETLCDHSLNESETSMHENPGISNNDELSTPLLSSTPKTSRPLRDESIASLCDMVSALSHEVEVLRERLYKMQKPNCDAATSTTASQTDLAFQTMQTQTDIVASQSKPTQTNENRGPSQSSQKTPKSPTIAKPVKENPRGKENIDRVQKEDEPSLSTYIIGSSITQRIRKRGLKPNVRIRTMRGAEVSTIRNEISTTNLESIGQIIIQAGGNDVSRGRDMEAIEEDFAEIINDVHRRSPKTKVYLSEITPRRNVNVHDVNAMLKSVCEMYGASLIRSSLAIGNVNARQFYKDGIHLSDVGTRDLLYAYEQYIPILKNGSMSGSCAFCGERGHNAGRCRHGGKISCYLCHETGHKAKYCGRH